MVTLTEGAVKKVRDYRDQDPQTAGKLFRIFVEAGGCSGFQYGFAFDEKRDGDTVVPCGDLEVVVDPESARVLKGSVIDYIEDFSGAGFSVKNPNAQSSCGCGKSFCG